MFVGVSKEKLTKMDEMFVMGPEKERGSVISLDFYIWWRGEWQIIKRIYKPKIEAGFVQYRKGKRKRGMIIIICHNFRKISFEIIICFSTLISWIQKCTIALPLFPIT